MNNGHMNKHFTLTMKMAMVGVLCSAIFSACRKDSNKVDNTTPTSSTLTTDEDSLKYLMYRIMQVTYVDGGRNKQTDLPTYLWYSQVPQLDPSSSNYATAEDLLNTIKTYSKNASGTVLDRYSFLDRTGSLSTSLQNGMSETFNKISATGNYGMEVSYASDNTRSYLYIVYADKNSPAGKKG